MYITVVLDVGPAESVGCVAQVPSMARLCYLNLSLSPQLIN